MKKFLKLVLGSLWFWLALPIVVALATQIGVSINNGSGSGSPYTYQMIVGPNGNVSTTGICDGTAGNNCAPTTANGLAVVHRADTVGGATGFNLISATSTNATSIKGSAGTVYSVMVISTITTSVPYVKLYDTSTAPNCNTQAVVQTYPVPANGGFSYPMPAGLAFTNGIGLCITANAAANDNTNGPQGITVDLSYK